MTLTFRSKVDRKFAFVALAALCAPFLAIGARPRTAPAGLWLPIALVSAGAVLVIWTLIATYYELRPDVLIAHCGPFSWRVPLREIVAVRESDSPRSGPALSLDRLEVEYGPGRVLLISPADKEGFLRALRHRAPGLRA